MYKCGQMHIKHNTAVTCILHLTLIILIFFPCTLVKLHFLNPMVGYFNDKTSLEVWHLCTFYKQNCAEAPALWLLYKQQKKASLCYILKRFLSSALVTTSPSLWLSEDFYLPSKIQVTKTLTKMLREGRS